MDGSLSLLVVLLVGFIALGLAAVAGGVDSRELDARTSSLSMSAEGE
jgi:hypothetical protein